MRRRTPFFFMIASALFFCACSRPTSETATAGEDGPDSYKVRFETAKGQFLFRVTDAGRDFLLQEGTDQRYGARHLKRSIERHVVYPLANLLATEQVHLGDLICIDWNKHEDRLTFVREGENLAIPARKPEPVAPARTAPAKGGKAVDTSGVTLSPEPTPRLAR